MGHNFLRRGSRMKKVLIAAVSISFVLIACVSPQKIERGVAASDRASFQSVKPATVFTDAEIEQLAKPSSDLASTSNFKFKKARLIIDNDAAFDSKLEMIKSAKNEIRMMYFIFAKDDSSSLISNALIAKAKSGVKVKLLVDFITNYKNLDHYQMMVNEGVRGKDKNIQIRFYNFPSKGILADAKYITLPCPPSNKNSAANECVNYKKQLIRDLKLDLVPVTPFSKMFLSGVYGKSIMPIKIALGYGAGIDPKKIAELRPKDEDESAVVTDYFELVKRATLDNDSTARVGMSLSIAANGLLLNPILNEITGRLPLQTGSENHAEEWDHLTDYIHHKLVAVDGSQFQLGGRNVEDSYHMKSRLDATKGKYIFKDTDFYGQTNPGGTKTVEASFDKLFKWGEMNADISQVQALLPNDMAAAVNSKALEYSTGLCLQQLQSQKLAAKDLGKCIETTIVGIPVFKNQNARIQDAKKEMEDSVVRYNTQYVGVSKSITDDWKEMTGSNPTGLLSQADLNRAKFYYLENVSYKKADGARMIRQTGARIGAEAAFNKNIHAAWYRGLENVCVASRNDGRERRVIIHTAYLLMPSAMMHTVAQMMNGDFGDCSQVRITFLTNSFETTDLNVINLFARYQLAQISKYYAGLVKYEARFNSENGANAYKRFFPKIEYFDYRASKLGTGISLHTKLSVLGDDIIVGSANADVRSYYMDTNNGVLIRGATDLNRDYIRFIDSIIDDEALSTNRTLHYGDASEQQLKTENYEILEILKRRWDKNGTKATPDRERKILALIDILGAKITNATYRMLNYRSDFRNLHGDTNPADVEEELNEIANKFDDFFKLL